MPEIVVHLAEGRTPEQKHALMKDITEAVTRNLAVPAEAVVVQLVEAPKADKMKGGLLYTERMAAKPKP